MTLEKNLVFQAQYYIKLTEAFQHYHKVTLTINSSTLDLGRYTEEFKSGYFGRIEETEDKNLILKAFIPVFYNEKIQTD